MSVRNIHIGKIFFFFFLLSVFSACDDDSEEDYYMDGSSYIDDSPYITFPNNLHVFLIGLDGWGGYSMPYINMPNVAELMSLGSYTFKKKSVLPSSSGPNWASLFMGVGVAEHGYTKWNSFTPDFQPKEIGPNGISPTICTLLKEQVPESKIGIFYDWEGIKYYVDTLAVDVCKQCSLYSISSGRNQLTQEACEYIIREKPTFCSIIYPEPDNTGHSLNFFSDAYYEKCNEIDIYIGQLINSIKEAGIYNTSVIILTSDHGGFENNHGGKTPYETETPFIICGSHVKKLGLFNQPIFQYDVAGIIAYIFNLEKPKSWIGRRCGWLFE